MWWVGGALTLGAIVYILYLRYRVSKLLVDTQNLTPLTLSLHDTQARVRSLEAEVVGLHAKAREIDEKEAHDILATGDTDRAIGFLRGILARGKAGAPKV